MKQSCNKNLMQDARDKCSTLIFLIVSGRIRQDSKLRVIKKKIVRFVGECFLWLKVTNSNDQMKQNTGDRHRRVILEKTQLVK